MEDEEGYTVLNLRPKWGNSAHLSPAGHQEPLMSVCCYKIALGALGAWCIVVTIAGIVLGAWGCCFKVCQGPPSTRKPPESDGVAQRSGSGRACNASLEDLVSRLKQSVCDPAQINSGGARCKLCPQDWLRSGNMCYWLSKETNTWSKSREDCARKGSELLVIQDREQMTAGFFRKKLFRKRSSKKTSSKRESLHNKSASKKRSVFSKASIHTEWSLSHM